LRGSGGGHKGAGAVRVGRSFRKKCERQDVTKVLTEGDLRGVDVEGEIVVSVLKAVRVSGTGVKG